ncbi:peptidoglycan DD-metalloendopeptidase family protein [Agreia sp. VKM Ac-1783]|uniref:peptidoglycan DD-metalloendopeptidase family protein n=1 Tax=Agreia sp. VKM Ac-1783 TaxID=1938889 RepID=UPI0011236E4E|nr:peptidoglycan DD-metalloendopeptidase family protein [Agreia sp. VKM Ac-1783]
MARHNPRPDDLSSATDGATPTTDAAPLTRRSRRQTAAAVIPDAQGTAAPQTRRAARAAGVAAPVILTEAQEREAERAAFENTVRPRGRRAAASTEELSSAAAFATTEPEFVATGVAEPTTPVSAVDVTVTESAVPSDAPADVSVPVVKDSAATLGTAPADVLGEVVPPSSVRVPGRRAVSDSSDDENTPPRVKAGRRAASTSSERSRVSLPKSAADASGNGSGEAAIPQQRRRRPSTKMIAKKSFGMFAFLVAGGIAVATSLPAEAYFAATPNASISQSVQVQADQNTGGDRAKQQARAASEASAASVDRDSYTITTVPKVSMTGFNTADTFSNDTSGTIQWPFPTGVPISDGFGYRSSPGGIGSTNHQGIDFNPGMGAPIQVIADGTVRLAQKSDAGGYGCYVIVDHNVNGMKFASLYGHMQCNSVAMSKGEDVKVGQQVGNVGSTGTSTGAHLHFEIHNASDTPIDPMPWLNQYAN